jgi:hypothetical protein
MQEARLSLLLQTLRVRSRTLLDHLMMSPGRKASDVDGPDAENSRKKGMRDTGFILLIGQQGRGARLSWS